MNLKLTPAEQHIAEQSERRDLTAICQRLARIEDRMARFEQVATATKNIRGDIESLKHSLEGAHESIERLMNRTAPDLLPKIPGSDWKILADEEATKTFSQDQMRRMARVGVVFIARTDRHLWIADHSDGTCSRWGATMLAEDIVNDIEEIEREARKPGSVQPMPMPDPMPGFEFGAKLRRQVEEDMATICGQEPAAEFNRVPPFVRSAPAKPQDAQDAYNHRMSEILARVAADIERANAYYALADRLRRGFGVKQTEDQAGVELAALWKALGSPQRPGEQPPEGHDNAEG